MSETMSFWQVKVRWMLQELELFQAKRFAYPRPERMTPWRREIREMILALSTRKVMWTKNLRR